MQQSLFKNKEEISLESVFRAYYDCRKNKRNNLDALEYELDFEKDVIRLWEEINNGTYSISPLDVFVVDKPVKREIFAAKFRDRIIHHLVIGKLNYLFEDEFIYDSYSCREGKGTHFGVERMKKFLRSCSENYQKDCYILKLDVKGYFMSINKGILLEKLVDLINENYRDNDKKKIIRLCKKIIMNDPTKNCVIKSPKRKWRGLPKSKSLFFAKENCGLPVGNYTNQIFANFYLNPMDHYIKHDLKIRYYGRYVDDFFIMSKNKEELKKLIPEIGNFLEKNLKLTIHPKKIYLQHYHKGVEFLGFLVKPHRSYITSRTKNNFYKEVESINHRLKKLEPNDEKAILNIMSKVNSYLGMLRHCDSYKLRKKMIEGFSEDFWLFFKVDDNLMKIEKVCDL